METVRASRIRTATPTSAIISAGSAGSLGSSGPGELAEADDDRRTGIHGHGREPGSRTRTSYTRRIIEVLFVCSANQCRSPMAAALLRNRLTARGIGGDEVLVGSAGLLSIGSVGAPATGHARRVVPGLDDHASRRLERELVERADLVVGMTRQHLREAAVLADDAFAKTFTLRDLARRVERRGPRHPAGETFAEWVGALHDGRRPADFQCDDPADDIADPIGGPRSAYEATARELDDLLARFAALAWPGAGGPTG